MMERPVKDYLMRAAKPVFVLQGGKDVQVSVAKDFNYLGGQANAVCKPHPGLNHLFMKAVCGSIQQVLEDPHGWRARRPGTSANRFWPPSERETRGL